VSSRAAAKRSWCVIGQRNRALRRETLYEARPLRGGDDGRSPRSGKDHPVRGPGGSMGFDAQGKGIEPTPTPREGGRQVEMTGAPTLSGGLGNASVIGLPMIEMYSGAAKRSATLGTPRGVAFKEIRMQCFFLKNDATARFFPPAANAMREQRLVEATVIELSNVGNGGISGRSAADRRCPSPAIAGGDTLRRGWRR